MRSLCLAAVLATLSLPALAADPAPVPYPIGARTAARPGPACPPTISPDARPQAARAAPAIRHASAKAFLIAPSLATPRPAMS